MKHYRHELPQRAKHVQDSVRDRMLGKRSRDSLGQSSSSNEEAAAITEAEVARVRLAQRPRALEWSTQQGFLSDEQEQSYETAPVAAPLDSGVPEHLLVRAFCTVPSELLSCYVTGNM
jgi:hypothetical protein